MFPTPPGAWDCHMHFYDRRHRAVAGATLTPPDASVPHYRALQRLLGTTRTVVVTPSTYGTDNALLVESLRHLGDSARGVAVVEPSATDAELQALHEAGVRAIRFNQTLGAVVGLESLEPLAERIAPLGWHVELLLKSADLVPMEARLQALPVAIVFDHMGRLPESGVRHPGFGVIRRLLESGNAWVKLSGAYLQGAGAEERYAAAESLARAYLEVAPERAVWGSNWPHPSATAGTHIMPDDLDLLLQLARWTDDESLYRRVLVEGPETLYAADGAAPGVSR